jgi:SAM-dependent methyltransferase
VLDLMSSWRSHLPHAGLGAVVGLGMNAAEMGDNPQLDSFVVHNLNREPTVPFPDASFDAVVCAVSVQYLTRPVEVFADVRRVLVASAPLIVSFSNRCFPTKAVAVWLDTTDEQHVRLVQGYFAAAGGFDEVTAEDRSTGRGDPLYAVWARASSGTIRARP